VTPSGTLEKSYGKGGVLIPRAPDLPPIETSEPEPLSLLLAPEGRAYLSGQTAGRGGFIFAREPDGAPDFSFGKAGLVRESPTLPSNAGPVSLTLGPGAAIDVLAFGEPIYGGGESFITRLRPDGRRPTAAKVPVAPIRKSFFSPLAVGRDHFLAIAVDELAPTVIDSFGPAGLSRAYGTDGAYVPPRAFTPLQLLRAGAGRVLVLGRFRGRSGFAVIGLDRYGDLDRRYGNDGVVALHLGPPRDTRVASGTVSGDGSLLLTGQISGDAGVVRLKPDGSLDRRFGQAGRLRVLGRHTVATSAVQVGGELVISCSREYDGRRRGSIFVGLRPAGKIDRAFAAGGLLRAFETSVPLAVLAAGPALISAKALGPHRGGVLLRAYLPDGRPDEAFGHHGETTVATGQNRRFKPIAAAVQAAGRIVVLGRAGRGPFRQRADLLRIR
jgi:hypothetical protein